MTGPHASFERRVRSGLDAAVSRIPVIIGGCGSGRTTLLSCVQDRIGRGAAQYIDVERCATTPERFFRAVTDASPFPWTATDAKWSPLGAFEATLRFFDQARAQGGAACTFLLDEFLELRTFESFPGLRRALPALIEALSTSPNRFVLTTRYATRANRLLREATSRFEVMPMPDLGADGVGDLLAERSNGSQPASVDDRDETARTVLALTGGRASYVQALGDAMAQMGRMPDPVSALAAQLSVGGALNLKCRFCYELRLHRARGYGALKAILDVLAAEEPLNLTQIAIRLDRTPGSTKDYLSWLEDVDLIASERKKYSFTDPLLRLWVRLHCRTTAPSDDAVAREVQQYAFARLAASSGVGAIAVPAGVGVGDGPMDERKNWGIIEID